MLAKYREIDRSLLTQDAVLHKAALLLALERGQYLATPLPAHGPTDLANLSQQMREAKDEQTRIQRAAMEVLTTRLGRPLKDWAYSVFSTHEPDGVGRVTVVYFTHDQAPEVFAGRQKRTDLVYEQRRELRQFFAELRD